MTDGRRLIDGSEPIVGISINKLILQYRRHVEQYYVRNGEATSEQSNIRQAVRWLTRLYGTAVRYLSAHCFTEICDVF